MDEWQSDALSYDDWEHFEPDDDPYDDTGFAPAVGDQREGEALEERNERIRARNAADRERDRLREPPPSLSVRRAPKERVTLLPRMGPASAARRGQVLSVNDEAAPLRLFFKRGAQAAGFTYAELVRKTPPGRPTESEKARRDVLARLVAQARDERQARVETIAEVIRRPIVTVHQLAADGRKIAAAG